MKLQTIILSALLIAAPLAVQAQSGSNGTSHTEPALPPTTNGTSSTAPADPTTGITSGTTTGNMNNNEVGVGAMGPTDGKNPAANSLDDAQALLAKIHGVNQFEIDTAKLAQARGQSAQVKSYGKTLQRDHEKADRKILSFADKQGYKITAPPSDEDQQHTMDRLNTLRGKDFDQAFIDAMEDGHQKAIRMIEEARSSIDDKKTKALLTELLPELRHHQKMAHNIDSKVLGSRKPGSASQSSEQSKTHTELEKIEQGPSDIQ
jgi:putative membrane protein